VALAGAAIVVSACSSTSSPASKADAAALVDASASADAALTGDEGSTFQSGSRSMGVSQQVTALAYELFDFDPTVNPSDTATENASAIGARITASLGSCGSVKVTGATVIVDFGAGCTLADGTTVSGTVAVAVDKSGATTTIALTLSDTVVNGEPLAGTASFATTTGTSFNVTANLTSGAKTYVANLTVTGTSTSFTVSGSATETTGAMTSKVAFDAMTITLGECYATGGSMAVTEGAVTETITFNAATPSTGRVTVSFGGKRSSQSTLPAYGSCPSDGASKDGGKR